MIMLFRKLYLIRGLPGSSKTTKAYELNKEIVIKTGLDPCVCEADEFFEDAYGVYKFDARRLKDAHEYCQLLTQASLLKWDSAIVSNTSTTLKDIYPYVRIADEYRAELIIVNVDTPWAMDVQQCFEKNVHGCPKSVIQAMKDRWAVVPNGTYDPDFFLKEFYG